MSLLYVVPVRLLHNLVVENEVSLRESLVAVKRCYPLFSFWRPGERLDARVVVLMCSLQHDFELHVAQVVECLRTISQFSIFVDHQWNATFWTLLLSLAVIQLDPLLETTMASDVALFEVTKLGNLFHFCIWWRR